MKNLIGKNLIFGLFSLALALSSCNKKSDDPVLDFNITIPDNWRGMVLANEGWIYSASRTSTGPNDNIVESLYIVKQDLPNSSLNTYYSLLSLEISDQDAYNDLLYESDTVINDVNYKKMISKEYIFLNSGHDTVNIITDRYFCYKYQAGFNMLFTSVDSLYHENKAIFDQIIGTIEFK